MGDDAMIGLAVLSLQRLVRIHLFPFSSSGNVLV